jgi:hypothetical protein
MISINAAYMYMYIHTSTSADARRNCIDAEEFIEKASKVSKYFLYYMHSWSQSYDFQRPVLKKKLDNGITQTAL